MMKVITTTAFSLTFLLTTGVLRAQQPTCSSAVSSIDLDANEITARIRTNGILFSDAQFLYNPDPSLPANPSTMFAASLWIGGVDPAMNLALNCPTYGEGNAAGPLNADGLTSEIDCNNWDRLFAVSGNQVADFLADLPDLAGNPSAALSQYKSIMGWPGVGNPYFDDAWGYNLPVLSTGLAPFFDSDGDGMYNSLKGDYPVVALQGKAPFLPALIVWCVSNDSNTGQTWNMETQLTAWQFDCPDQPVLNRSLFTSHKLIYKGFDILDSCFAGIWVDFDLGCYTDDYLGCNPALDAFFAYNQDALDGSSGTNCADGTPTFADNPPVQSVTMLSRSMDKFIYFNNPSVGNQPIAMTDPGMPLEYYQYLNGRWRDGTPLTHGGSGYNPASSVSADFAFPDAPSSPSGWNMCTVNLPLGDRKALGINKVGKLLPGAVMEFTTAWTLHSDATLPCGIGSTFAEIELLRSHYDGSFLAACSPLSGTAEIPEEVIEVFPNPSTGNVRIRYGDLPVQGIRLFSPDGSLLQVIRDVPASQTNLELAEPAGGIYTVQLLTERGIAVKKIAVLR